MSEEKKPYLVEWAYGPAGEREFTEDEAEARECARMYHADLYRIEWTKVES